MDRLDAAASISIVRCIHTSKKLQPTDERPFMTSATMIVTCSGGTYFDRDYYVDVHPPLALASWQKHGLESAVAFFPRDVDPVDVSVGIYRFRDEAALHAALAAIETVAVMEDVPASLTLPFPELSEPRSDFLLSQCIGRYASISTELDTPH